ncbi:hypothetical protein [Duganella aceris]|uniref:hypothetical protein n=1 Tax=Duganella aceris TaxID=2703883 RepID=UPI001A9552F4|nr:hypothetical protein [Duganella aceris]
MDHLRDSGAATDPAEAVDAAVLHWLAAMKQGSGAGTPAPPMPKPPQPPTPAHLATPASLPAPHQPFAPQRDGGTVISISPMLERQVVPGPGWTEPERRKFRYRIEDVAFDVRRTRRLGETMTSDLVHGPPT